MVMTTMEVSPVTGVELLRRCPLFFKLDAEAFEKITRLMVERRVDRDEILWLDGDPGKKLYFIASGLIKLFKTSAAGKEQIIKVVGPGESLGESALFDNNGNSVSAQAMIPSVIFGLDKSKLGILFAEHPQLALNISRVLARQAHDYLSLVEDLSFKPVTSRLARVLLAHNGEDTARPLRLTQQEMAAMTGSVREVIGRTLKSLAGEGVIRLERQRIVITDRQALRKISTVSN